MLPLPQHTSLEVGRGRIIPPRLLQRPDDLRFCGDSWTCLVFVLNAKSYSALCDLEEHFSLQPTQSKDGNSLDECVGQEQNDKNRRQDDTVPATSPFSIPRARSCISPERLPPSCPTNCNANR